MAFNERKAASGAASGAATGSALGPKGMAIGAVAGGLLGGFSGNGSNSVQERLDLMLQRRLSQIGEFSKRMDANRQRLLDRTQALQNLAYSRFAANLEAQFAARGKQVTGGGFQSGLGQEAASQQAQLTQYEADLARQDELAAQNQISQAYGTWNGQSADFNLQEYSGEQASDKAEGGAISQAVPILLPELVKGAKSLSQAIAMRRQAKRPELKADTASFAGDVRGMA